MFNSRVVLSFVFACWLLPVFGGAPVGIEWSEQFSLHPQPGAADTIGVGFHFYGEHNGVTLLAGGSNFSDKPLVEGGKRHYADEIYALLLILRTGLWLVSLKRVLLVAALLQHQMVLFALVAKVEMARVTVSSY